MASIKEHSPASRYVLPRLRPLYAHRKHQEHTTLPLTIRWKFCNCIATKFVLQSLPSARTNLHLWPASQASIFAKNKIYVILGYDAMFPLDATTAGNSQQLTRVEELRTAYCGVHKSPVIDTTKSGFYLVLRPCRSDGLLIAK